ncbi:MAG: BamA/TamA family outer membrane protein [Ignavibacteriales bacterium]|nr:BamA/TamA family outer membrane protein [Ignavibacteriales bacterium]
MFFFPQFISSQVTNVYNINGCNELSEQIFIECIYNNSSKSNDEIIKFIGQEFIQKGFYDFKILNFSIDTNNVKDSIFYSLDLIEGKPTYIRNVIVDSLAQNDSLEILSYFDFLKGEIFIKEIIESRIENILQNLENSGYPFASIKIKSVVFNYNNDSSKIADIYLAIDKEKIRKLDKVEISGNTKTKDYVIINTARLTKGELYSQERIEEIPILLNKTRFFKSISTPTYLVNSAGEGILQLNIEEKNTNSFDGIIGYVPATSSKDEGYLTGFVNISLLNLFGTGRAAAIRWKQENTLTQELELKYLEPWLFDQPFNLNVNFFQRKQDSSYVKRIFGGNIEYLATENISASVIIESESTIPSIDITNNSILNSTSLNTGLQLKLDYRDDIYSPRSGIYFASTYKYRNKKINSDELPIGILNDNLEYHNYELEFGFFYTLFQNQVLALGVHAKEVIGDYYDISDFFQLGGTNSLRGYRENQFYGNRIIWSNFEYRFLLSQSSYLFTFYDLGYYLISENLANNTNRQSDLNSGYGLGISLDTALGIMRVSYAMAEGTSISNGLIHFGLLNDF